MDADRRPDQLEDKGRSGTFTPGNRGGPGRPAGLRNKASFLLDALAEGEAEAILRPVVDAAKTDPYWAMGPRKC